MPVEGDRKVIKRVKSGVPKCNLSSVVSSEHLWDMVPNEHV